MSIKKRNEERAMSFQDFVNNLKDTQSYEREVARAEISDQIHRLMELNKVRPSELARRLGKSRAYVTKVLQGNANFTIDTLVEIARALDCRYMPVLLPKVLWQQVEAIRLSANAANVSEGVTYPSDKYEPVSTNN